MIALLLVCVSVTLPRLADSEYSIYVPQLQCSNIIDSRIINIYSYLSSTNKNVSIIGLLNNMHCMAIAIPELTRAALFTLAKPGALYDLLSEFLAVYCKMLLAQSFIQSINL